MSNMRMEVALAGNAWAFSIWKHDATFYTKSRYRTSLLNPDYVKKAIGLIKVRLKTDSGVTDYL